jgi:hypothetical protein
LLLLLLLLLLLPGESEERGFPSTASSHRENMQIIKASNPIGLFLQQS